MEKINFVNNQAPVINSTNLNQLQTNVENAINEVVESGSNGNGSYVKFADGTLEQRGRLEIAADVNYCDLVFPIPFVGNKDEIVMSLANIYRGGGDYGGTQSILCLSSAQINTLSAGYIYSLFIDGEIPSFKRIVSYIAIGRWK